jgi:TRAP-type C4-dicarboxylate transport system substrate-binding protein
MILDEVADASNGRLKMEYYYSGSLVPAKEELDGLKDKVADIATVSPGYMPGKIPLLTVATLPATSKSYFAAAMAMADLCKMPEIQEELGKWNVRYLSFLQTSSYGIFSRKPIHSIAEMKGLKLRTFGDQAALVKALGAVPVAIVSTEVYTALQRGTLDGALANPTFGQDYKFEEPCPNYFRLPFGTATHMMAISNDAWNKIPAELQKMFEDRLEENARKAADMYEGSGERRMQEKVAKGTMKITEPSAADMELLMKIAKQTIWNGWIEKMNKRGLAGQKVLDRWLELNAKWEKRM